MKHFSFEHWADFVRGTIAANQRLLMEAHLKKGCKICRDSEEILRNVFEFAHREAGLRPPDGVVDFVKRYFTISKPGRNLPGVSKVAQLIFDTFRQPLPAGIRSSESQARHLVYRVGRMFVDVRLEPTADLERISLAGQVLAQSDAHGGTRDLTVAVRSPKRTLVSTATNEFGEFRVELDSVVKKQLHLAIGLDDNTTILIPLRALEAPRPRISMGA